MDYKDKIKKLLALSNSSNEFEAKAALLKARELMAKHKISEHDFADIKKKEVKTIYTGVTYTKRGEYWIPSLAAVIAENYCCRTAANIPYRGAQKRTMMFVGLVGDVDLCVKIFEYAVESARKCSVSYLRRKFSGRGDTLTAKDKADIKNSYSLGFASGVGEAFKDQNEKEAGWGLVMTVPQEVNDACNFRKDTRATRKTIYGAAKSAGYEEGTKFKPNRRLS